MICRLKSMLFCHRSTKYTSQQIADGIDLLVHKIAKIGLSAEIISPYFSGNKIKGKNIIPNNETMPLVIILQDAIRYHYGQLGRSYFDSQGREKNTASLTVLRDQIFNNDEDGKKRIKTFRDEFKNINDKLSDAQPYKRNLNKYCNKHFAHTDIQSLAKIKRELITISVPWEEFIILIDNAKSILRSMCLVCKKSSPDFAESTYMDFKEKFWNLINFKEMKTSDHPK